MLLAKGRHWLAVLLSVCIAAVAYSDLPVGDSDRMFVTYPASVASDAVDTSFSNFSRIAEFPDHQFRAIAEKFLNPPLSSNYSDQATNLKSLPAVPGTIFMVLTGFICVSLVKDRKIWIAALAGLFWLSQASVTSLPKLASHLYSRKHIEHSVQNLTCAFEINNFSRPRSDIQGSEYMGLLRRLGAIPANTITSLFYRVVGRTTNYALLTTQYAILNTQYPIHNIQLARGPPSLYLKTKFDPYG